MKSVLKYSDYREFLRDHATHKRKSNPRWSIGLWARKLKLGSTTSLNMILNGQRHPGNTISERLVDYFGFEPRERDYFLDLIEFAKVQRTGTNRNRLKHLLADDLKNSPQVKPQKSSTRKPFSRFPIGTVTPSAR
ncbi:MAG: TIGR02147 family protein [Bdellovibrionales bacterium]|nr:TIGR02147 family protein [Bdellovibrionales bacterium]